jgi:hypothetical protein
MLTYKYWQGNIDHLSNAPGAGAPDSSIGKANFDKLPSSSDWSPDA